MCLSTWRAGRVVGGIEQSTNGAALRDHGVINKIDGPKARTSLKRGKKSTGSSSRRYFGELWSKYALLRNEVSESHV